MQVTKFDEVCNLHHKPVSGAMYPLRALGARVLCSAGVREPVLFSAICASLQLAARSQGGGEALQALYLRETSA
jgi:hypothetical protein